MKTGWIAAAFLALSAPALADDTIKIAYIDPLSGGGASIGEIGLKHYRYLADQINAAGGLIGKKVEIVGLDNKTNPQESLIQAQKAADPGHPLSSPRATARRSPPRCPDWVAKYNERNPGKEIVYLNYAAVDPVLTNDKCSYWHFRWDANSDIKMAALTNFMKDRPNIKKVYLINQDYSFGQCRAQRRRARCSRTKRPGHRDRRRRSASAAQGDGFRALHRQDQGVGRRHASSPATGARISRCC